MTTQRSRSMPARMRSASSSLQATGKLRPTLLPVLLRACRRLR